VRLPQSKVDIDRPVDEPFTPTELADMRRHLAFLRKNRTILRLKFNAAEDLLVNGLKEPDHRGRCRHLLSKVDRGAITAALNREPLASQPGKRVEFLAGAAAITGELSVLLQFLEAKGAAASKDAAGTFTLAVQQVDFSEISAARMGQLLDVMTTVFNEHELPGVLFGLLQGKSFSRAFDQHADHIKPEIIERFAPLRAVFNALSAGRKGRGKSGKQKRISDELAKGVFEMLSAPVGVVANYNERVRKALLETAIAARVPWIADSDGLAHLLKGLNHKSDQYQRLSSSYAKQLIALGEYNKAKAALRDLSKAHPGLKEAKQLATLLEQPRIAHFAVAQSESSDGLRPATSLLSLGKSLVRVGGPSSNDQFATEAALQSNICLPGVVDVLESGRSSDDIPYVAVRAIAPRLDEEMARHKKPLARELAFRLALAGIRIFHALELAGVALPDSKASRFLFEEPDRLWLADFSGALTLEPERASQAARECAAAFCRGALSYPAFGGEEARRDLSSKLKNALKAAFTHPPPTVELAEILKTAL